MIPSTRSIRRALAGLTLVFLPLIAACGGNVTSGGFGEVEVLLSSDQVEELTQGALASLGVAAADSNGLRGTLTVTVRSFIRSGRGVWIEVTNGPQQVVVPLEDPAPVQVARIDLFEGSYDAVRTHFGRIRVQVQQGLSVGGEPVTGEVEVELGLDGALLVELRPLRVARRERLSVLLEMNARRWLPLLDRERRLVEEVDFRREFRVRTRAGG
jgi:hypothetical protein